MTSAQVVEKSVTNNSSFQNYTHLDDHTIRTTDTPGFKPFAYFLPFAFSTLCIFYTPHFAQSSFSALLIFYSSQIQHSALHVFHRTLFSLQFSPFKYLFRSQIDHRNNEKLSSGSVGSLSRIYAQHYIGKGFLLWSKNEIKCVHYRWPRRNDKLCTRLFSRATNTSAVIAYIS